jgi:hypothetical protein
MNFLISLDIDNKNLNSDLSLPENPNSQLSRILQPITISGTKSIDVKKIYSSFLKINFYLFV